MLPVSAVWKHLTVQLVEVQMRRLFPDPWVCVYAPKMLGHFCLENSLVVEQVAVAPATE